MTQAASARPVAMGKEGHVFGAKPSEGVKKRFSEDLRTRFVRLFAESDIPNASAPPKMGAAPLPPGQKPDQQKEPKPTPPAPPKPSTGPYNLGFQNSKSIPQAKKAYSEALAFVDTILLEAKKKKKKGFVSQEISHLMHGKAIKGPLKGKHVPQRQAVADSIQCCSPQRYQGSSQETLRSQL